MSTQPNPVMAEAVNKLNEQRMEQAVAEAVRLGNCVVAEQAKIAKCRENIAKLQEEGNKVTRDVIDDVRIFGSPLPDNANRETVAKVVERANKERQYNIEQTTDRITRAVVAEQDAIVLIEKRIADLRTAALKIEVPTITVQQVVG